MRGEHYGRLGIATIQGTVRQIWYSKNIEPEPCEPIDFYWPTMTDPDLILKQDFARRLVAITPLTQREEQAVIMCVLGNCTLEEVGEVIGCTRQHVHYILKKAIKKFRESKSQLT
jgi:RNA polymerase sigma factor (sigma-70 family)